MIQKPPVQVKISNDGKAAYLSFDIAMYIILAHLLFIKSFLGGLQL